MLFEPCSCTNITMKQALSHQFSLGQLEAKDTFQVLLQPLQLVNNAEAKILFTFDSNYVPPINMLMFYGQVVYVPCKNVSGQCNEKTGCDFYVSIFFSRALRLWPFITLYICRTYRHTYYSFHCTSQVNRKR